MPSSTFVTCPHAGQERAALRPRPPLETPLRPPCPVCGQPVHEALIALGEDRHVNCADPKTAAAIAACSLDLGPSVVQGGTAC